MLVIVEATTSTFPALGAVTTMPDVSLITGVVSVSTYVVPGVVKVILSAPETPPPTALIDPTPAVDGALMYAVAIPSVVLVTTPTVRRVPAVVAN